MVQEVQSMDDLLEYNQSHYNPCIYHKKVENSKFFYLLLYVDNILIASRDETKR